VPCVANGLVIGAISVFDVPERRFDSHDEELLLSLANHAAIAIDNARLYRQSVRSMEHASILASSARSLAMHLTPEEIYAGHRAHLEDIARRGRPDALPGRVHATAS